MRASAVEALVVQRQVADEVVDVSRRRVGVQGGHCRREGREGRQALRARGRQPKLPVRLSVEAVGAHLRDTWGIHGESDACT